MSATPVQSNSRAYTYDNAAMLFRYEIWGTRTIKQHNLYKSVILYTGNFMLFVTDMPTIFDHTNVHTDYKQLSKVCVCVYGNSSSCISSVLIYVNMVLFYIMHAHVSSLKMLDSACNAVLFDSVFSYASLQLVQEKWPYCMNRPLNYIVL